MRELTEAAKAAKEIRAMLKKNGIQARVKSKSYSMGSSVDIYTTDLAPWVEAAIKKAVEPYEYGTFDSMTDCSGFKNESFKGPQAKHVFFNNSMSDQKHSEIWEIVRATFAGFEDAPEDHKQAWNFQPNRGFAERGDMMIGRLFRDHHNDYGVWAKPRVRAA
jgi:hypothetical protein